MCGRVCVCLCVSLLCVSFAAHQPAAQVYERDIRREYSAALQCLRYIVQNGFLQ